MGIPKILIITTLIFLNFISPGQNKSRFVDGRDGNYCANTQKIISEMPKEVLFGIQINSNGEVYFSMSDKAWFEKIFRANSFGVSIDIISKSRYNCSIDLKDINGIPIGLVLPAIYKKELLENSNELVKGSIFTKIGNIPASLVGK
ncbi:MAG: hypothetical protein ABIW38_03420, partial [Ferruginibacter sp.]